MSTEWLARFATPPSVPSSSRKSISVPGVAVVIDDIREGTDRHQATGVRVAVDVLEPEETCIAIAECTEINVDNPAVKPDESSRDFGSIANLAEQRGPWSSPVEERRGAIVWIDQVDTEGIVNGGRRFRCFEYRIDGQAIVACSLLLAKRDLILEF